MQPKTGHVNYRRNCAAAGYDEKRGCQLKWAAKCDVWEVQTEPDEELGGTEEHQVDESDNIFDELSLQPRRAIVVADRIVQSDA